MKLATIRTPAGTTAARIDGQMAGHLPFVDLKELLEQPSWRELAAGPVGDTQPTVGLEYAPLVPHPDKIICVGLNYRSHIREMGRDLPEYPALFAKFASALLGADDPIVLPLESGEVDWEAELALVVGATIRRATPAEAVDAIAGYAVANDVTARDWQWRTPEWLQGKTFDATTPLGPTLTTCDVVDPGRTGRPKLKIRCAVDGEVMQEANTDDLLFSPADLVAYVSRVLTLVPGDVILTGTPGGVGAGRSPKVFLKHGQTVEVSIEDLGVLTNVCTEESSSR